MGQLAPADVRSLLEFVNDLGGGEQTSLSPQLVLDQLVELIPCANAVHFHRSSDCIVAVAGDLEFPPPVCAAAAEFALQRPTAAELLNAEDGAVTLSVRLSRKQLRGLDFYQYAMRPLGVEDELVIILPTKPPAVGGFSLLRERPFSERDRTMLELLAPHLAKAADRFGRSRLTERELEILSWVARGSTNKEIARILGLKPSTVRTHLEHVFEKLGVHTRTAAVARAFRRN